MHTDWVSLITRAMTEMCIVVRCGRSAAQMNAAKK